MYNHLRVEAPHGMMIQTLSIAELQRSQPTEQLTQTLIYNTSCHRMNRPAQDTSWKLDVIQEIK